MATSKIIMTTTRDGGLYEQEEEGDDDEKLHSKNLMSLSSAGNSLFFLYEQTKGMVRSSLAPSSSKQMVGGFL